VTIEAEFTDTNVPVKLTVNNSSGGVAGLTVNLQVLDGETQNSRLDFNDNTFKTSGHTQINAAVTDVSGGRYSLNNGLDVSSIIFPAGVKKLILEYNISGSVSGVVSEELLLRESTYQAKVWFSDDNLNVIDRYTVVFFKNSEPITAGITLPTIQVIQASDGADLIASVALTQVASLGIYKHDESTNRILNGQSYYVKIDATIDGKTRTWYQQVSRDA